jgi:hypothetical protein
MTSDPITHPLREPFRTQVEEVLVSDEIAETLAAAEVEPDAVRLGIKEHWESVARSLEIWQRGAERAQAALSKAEEQLAAFQPSRWARIARVIGWTLATAGLAICVFLAATESLWWLYLLFLASIPLVLIGVPGEQRSKKREELRIEALTRRRDVTEELLESALALRAVTTVRETINAQLVCFDTSFRIFDARGLEQLADAQREIPTRATERLTRLMASLTFGSIGLSGSRGCGKTTLINSFVEGDSTVPMERTRRGFVVSAPVRYDAREFVLHLFTRLCEEVLGEKGLEDVRNRRAGAPAARQRRALACLLGGAGTLLLIAGALMWGLHRTGPKGPTETGGLYVGLGAVLLYVTFFVVMWARMVGRRSAKLIRTPERTAEEHLEEIRYQQSLASGWSGGIKLPLGLTLGSDSKTTLARSPMTLPEVVDRFRRYAATLSEEHYWVIGIDELDKMESEDAARRFLNDIKGVFGVSRCYYLVSVSEDAMSSFERRGLPFRDVFDSSFDAIERVGYLSFAESQDVLERRVVGLPVPFQMVCHCLSGGLPRDLIRVARELVHHDRLLVDGRRDCEGDERERASTLEELCSALVRAELDGKVSAALIAARAAIPDTDRQWLLAWLRDEEARNADAESLRTRCARLAAWPGVMPTKNGSNGGTQTARNIALELGAFSYYAATLVEFFTDDLDRDRVQHVIEGDLPIVERLAGARQDFSLSPFLAWRAVSDFRAGVDGLVPWDAPTPALVPAI